MWSVRMRASRAGEHVSGAEGLFDGADVRKALDSYYRRAAAHERGEPDSIVLSIEKVAQRPAEISSLGLSTLAACETPRQARRHCRGLLAAAGVSAGAVAEAYRVLRGRRTMRGAALISARGALRLEPDRRRGVRTSRLGLSGTAGRSLRRGLSRLGIDTPVVAEALTLASKALSCPGVVAELCISDDPGYTTGYVASRELGYVRVPNMKQKGDPRGGRVYFVKDGARVDRIIDYLQNRPVVVAEISGMRGQCRR